MSGQCFFWICRLITIWSGIHEAVTIEYQTDVCFLGSSQRHPSRMPDRRAICRVLCGFR